jgi:glucokinase
MENAANMPWKGVVPLSVMLQDQLGMAVAVANDAHITALGEKAFGSAHGMKDFIVVSISHGGLGSCIFTNGLPHLGINGFAGEVGHTCVEVNGRQCGCGRKGCLETYCSATGVAETAREYLASGNYPESPLHALPLDEITSKDVYDAAVQGDRLSNEVFAFTGQLLGESCADFATFSDPEAFIFFGGLTKAGDLLMEPIVKTYNEMVFDNYKGTARFLISQLKDAEAALLGAAALAWTDR